MNAIYGAARAALAATLALGATAQQRDVAEVGSTPAYQFREPVLNGRGIRSLAELRGRPTLVEFWGTA